MGAENDAAYADFRVHRDCEQVLEKRASLIGDERLGRAHAAGSAAREDYGGQHIVVYLASFPRRCCLASLSRLFRWTSQRAEARRASIPAFLCAAFSALRRTAINSATMLMAISSGDSAPISSPMGA